MNEVPIGTACPTCCRDREYTTGVDPIEILIKAMMTALTQSLGTDFASQVKDLIEQQSKDLAQSLHPDDQNDAKLVWLIAQGKLFRDLGV